jgi:hypothetical protein
MGSPCVASARDHSEIPVGMGFERLEQELLTNLHFPDNPAPAPGGRCANLPRVTY